MNTLSRTCCAAVLVVITWAGGQPVRAAEPPSVTTQPADAITDLGAMLHGTVNPNWDATSAWFEWGETTNYGHTSRPTLVGTVGVAMAAKYAVSGLSPRTTYHFRVGANNRLGTRYGRDRTFTTSLQILSCAADRSLDVGADCVAALPDLTGEVVVPAGAPHAGDRVITQSPLAGTLLGPGPTVVTLTVTDGLPQPPTCQATVIVSKPPTLVLECPALVEVDAAPGECAAAVRFAVVATDLCDPAPVVTCEPPAGSVLPVGRTTVLCTARSGSGEVASCSFPVVVWPTTNRLAGVSWQPEDSGAIDTCHAIASSADATKLVAAGDQLYTSSDSGKTWVPRGEPGKWASVASSADGTKLVAAQASGNAGAGHLYTSIDSGVTWTARSDQRRWVAVASSADGTKLVATRIKSAVPFEGQILTSTDSGATWVTGESRRGWGPVAISSDGTKLVACDRGGTCDGSGCAGGLIYTSSDSGQTWSPSGTSLDWSSVASSADGAKLVASAWGDRVWTSSDSGVTWVPREAYRHWTCVASSADGTRLVAVADSERIYISTDSGVTWTPQESARSWTSVTSSADGTKLAAATYDGSIYTSSDMWVKRHVPTTILGVANRVVPATGPQGAVVSYLLTATNVCQASIPVTCTPPSGSTFPVGVHRVTCEAPSLDGPSSASFTVTVIAPNPTRLAKFELLGNGTFRCRFTNQPGMRFTMLMTTNLNVPMANWSALGTVTEDPPGTFQFTDANATNGPQRFYRLRWP